MKTVIKDHGIHNEFFGKYSTENYLSGYMSRQTMNYFCVSKQHAIYRTTLVQLK